MAVYVKTEKASELLGKIKKAIDDEKIKTWKYDNDGDFYHSPDQWQYNGWLHPVATDKYLILGIIKPKDDTMTKLTYAIYHGRFIEMMLNHFDDEFDLIYASARKTQYDRF